MSIKLPPEAAKSLGIALPDGVKPPRGRGRGPKFVRPDPPPIGSRVLALDVSSTATGMAVVTMGERGPELIRHHVARPNAKWEVSRRVDDMILEIEGAAFGSCCRVVAMEMTDGVRWGTKRRTSHLVQLAIAQGRFYEAFRGWVEAFGGRPEPVSAAQWTGGVPKAERAERVRMIFPELRDIRDPGLDAHDAAGIGLWRLGL